MNKLDPGAAHGLTRENMMAALPKALREDPSMVALADAIAGVLEARREEIDRLRIYPEISRLDEQLLDILARDFKVDWWDADYSLEEKRRTLKNSWRVHKTLGTKAAVEMAVSAIYPNTQVVEWWEYGGEPYHFRLHINVSDDNIESDKQRRVLSRLDTYKNLRSHLDTINYRMTARPAAAGAGTVCTHWGMRVGVEIPIPSEVYAPHPKMELCAGAGAYGVHTKISTEVRLDGTLG